tara:strand:- start:3651 stop:4049 length:399 start_codon:yes stop_codon:yes gene_type:complete
MSKFKLSQAARVANISFEGTDFDGLEIKARLDLPMKIVLEIQRLVASEKTEDSIKANTIWCDKVLESWNLTDDEGNEIPANSENALAVAPARMIAAVISKWADLVLEPPANLSKPHNDTGMLEELANTSQSN